MPSARKRAARSQIPRAARGTDSGAGSPPLDPTANTRRWLAPLVALVVIVTGAIVWFARRPALQVALTPIARQNVLLITIDTLRADALGSYGGRAATPALDRLAAGGIRFDFAHAHAVLTLPSHTSILTGLYPYQHGIRDNSGYRLGAGAHTAATILKQAGYATAAFVGAFPLHSRFGLNTGFDVYDDRFGETRDPTEFVMPERPATSVVALARAWLHEHAVAKPSNPSTQHPEPSTQNRTLHPEPSAQNPSGSWFLWVHVFDPHAPYKPPPPFDTQYERPYDGEVAATDFALAPLLDDVRSSGTPTIVVVTGDHGEALGDHGEQTHGLFAYESTLHVPLIIAEVNGRSSDTPALGEVSSVAARHVDILPTLLDAVAQPVPAGLPGRSLLPASERQSGAARTSYFEAMSAMLNRGWAPLTGVLADRDKYIDVPIVERYDLAADAREATNLAGRDAERDRTLASVLRAFGAQLPGARKSEEPEAAARLRSLGYVTGSAPVKAHYTDADDPKTLLAVDQEFHRAVELYERRDYAAALDAYRAIVARRPDMAIAYRHLAFVTWETGQPREAIEILQRAVASGVTHGGVLTQLGTYLAESGSAQAAIPLLEPTVTGDAPDLDALNGLGIAYARSRRAADARRVFERMLSLDPNSSMALSNLGALDLEHDDLAAARRDFERAVAVDPTSSTAQSGLGVVSLKTGDRATAIAAWKRAVELDGTNYDALYNLGLELARSDMTSARPYLERFVRSAPPAFYSNDIRAVTQLLQRVR